MKIKSSQSTEYHKTKLIKDLRGKISDLISELTPLRKQVEQFNVIKETNARLKAEVERKINEIQRLKGVVNNLEETTSMLSMKLSETERQKTSAVDSARVLSHSRARFQKSLEEAQKRIEDLEKLMASAVNSITQRSLAEKTHQMPMVDEIAGIAHTAEYHAMSHEVAERADQIAKSVSAVSTIYL
ncbi:hypothetical protein HK101_011046 [Irineochytrium annulatum]|nr:hypothetical protein HK101_011046 [Irineochytrium annulatum]